MKNPFASLIAARDRNVAKRSGQQGTGGGNSAAGPNTNPTTGKSALNQKPSGDVLATRISKKPMVIAAAFAGIAAYGGYLYVEHSNLLDHHKTTHQSNVKPATATNYVPPTKPDKPKPGKPKPPDNHSHKSAKSSQPASDTGNSQTPPTPKKNPYAEQDAAFEASLGAGASGSGGSMGLSWTQQTNVPTAQSVAASATAPYVAAQNAVLAAAQQKSQKKKKQVHDTSPTLVTREISPYEVLQGSVIPAVLQTGIKSYLPGEITAVVSRNVYSSVNGATLLIPAGAKLVGTYATSTTLGTNRLMAAWTRIEFPNGTYINLPGFSASGGQGYAGFSGEINDHTWLIFKNALLMSIVDAGMAVASPTSTSSNTTGVTGNQALQDSEQSLSQTFGQAEAQMLQKDIDIAPTITIAPGYPFNVVATKDLVFPGPYNPAMQTGPGAVTPAVAPRPDPYNPYG